jgi:hypothetical protein
MYLGAAIHQQLLHLQQCNSLLVQLMVAVFCRTSDKLPCCAGLRCTTLCLCYAGAVVDSAVPPNRIANAAAATQQHRDHLELQGAWSKFVKLFLQTAAEVSTWQPAAKPCHSKPARCSRTVPQLQGPPSSPCLYTRLVCISSVLWDLFHRDRHPRVS